MSVNLRTRFGGSGRCGQFGQAQALAKRLGVPVRVLGSWSGGSSRGEDQVIQGFRRGRRDQSQRGIGI